MKFPASNLRFLGLSKADEKANGVTVHLITIKRERSDAQSIPAAVRKSGCDAVLGENDETAALIMRYLIKAGFKIPQQIRIGGFDDAPISELLPVAMTSVAQPIEALASEVISALQERSKTPSLPGRWIRLHGRLVARVSTKG